ncbi:MAG TPA: hypothetical protein DDW94_05100 [Deltaproteobacteria bacterium]|nr:MAG: hypothetical protein A2Z79_11070 [Deltaproteobacteria bacterium GWA2_55_82]OGQ64420.1 MAG: hypothetical protein A3I81_02995 [Deltaproteobacteria bacterium RIFCSPLOWO2_02_FULL_55_12]OIJ72799.1 MAG: hypothetical protein A2V21_300135 [Deltaproteobacteria bacterium GWC2_55_46]HBG46350.1 hypothetical protein [Deltaproteobacteria bacterium]HCY11575.1 hypothetical protein [Deltaproteobacteria bacterium]
MTQYVKTFSCPACGGLASGMGHLCHPRKDVPPFSCEFCGKEVEDARHVCSNMVNKLEYICKKCGRLAIYDSLLCEPAPIDEE